MKQKSKMGIGVLIVVLCVAALVYANCESLYSKWGLNLAEKESEEEQFKVLVKVNDLEITEVAFENAKMAYDLFGTKLSDEDIMKMLIREKAIASEAKKRGITVTEQEVKEFNDQRFDGMMQDPKMKQAMEDFLEGKQQTLEEYKEQSLAVSEAALIAMKLQEQLIKENQVKPEEVTKFLNDTVETLIENAVIERFDE